MTYSVDVYDKSGKVVSQLALNDKTFNDDLINESLIHEYYLLQTSNARKNIACVQGRWEVHWSGKKLYKQKGTGNSRVGGKQSPTRRGGWVAFGPRGNRNFIKEMPQKARKVALNGLLTIKARDNEICALKDFTMDVPKTKEAIEILKNIWLTNKKILLVVNEKKDNLTKSFNNIPKVKYITVDYLNPFDIMHSNKIIFLESAIDKVNK